MTNKLFKSFFAFAMILGSALGFVACEQENVEVGDPTVDVSTKSLNFAMEEGEQSVEITSNADWKIDTEDVDWITVTPERGNGNATIQVAVSTNDSGDVREATIKVIALHKTYGNWETKKIKVVQSASTDAPVTEELLYSDNFDGKEATKTYGSSGSSWPYIDQFPEFANAEGDAAANVTYTGSKVSVRANQQSNQSNYSNYAGSGSNNIFFGDGGYFVVNNIAPLSADEKNYKITFGVQKYAGNDGDSSFKYTDFLLYISKDGEKWAPVEYAIADLVEGKYNVATADFTLAAATDKLYIKFVAKVASVLRMDDLKFFTGNGGQEIDLDNIQVVEPELPEMVEATAAEFLAAAEDSTVYKLTGEITRVVNTSYGNFDITDATGTVYVYGLLTPDGEPQKQFAAAGLKQGDTITVYGTRTSYNGSPQMKNATYISHVAGEGGETPAPEPAEGIYASDAAFVCSTDDSTNAAYSLGATTINGNAVTGFKLGKSKQAGKFTSGAVGVDGAKYLNFYAQGWKGGDVTLYFRVDGGATQSVKLASHDGVTGNPPFTALAFADTDHYSFLLEGLTASSTIEFSTDANFALTSSDSTMASARAIVCGVKLTDEPIEGGGNTDNPTPEPEGTVTIAEAIAAADGAAIVIENATVVGVYARGVLVEDTTGKLLVYAGSAVSAEVGDVVKVEGTMATYGGLRQVATPTVTVTGTTSYTYPTATVMDGAAMDAYLSNPVIKYVEYTGTLAISGYYYNVTVEGAATAVGSLAYVIDGSVDASLDGQKILVKGWTIGFSGGKYVNTMISSVTAADGGTTQPTPDPDPTPGEVQKVTVAEFLAAAEGDTVYELTGVIKNVANTLYGNFDLQDETGTVYVYGIYDADGNKVFTSLGLKEGDTLTMRGVRTSYQNEPQVGNGVYVSHVVGETPEAPANSATLSFADVANRTSLTAEQQVWEQNGVKLTNDKASSTTDVADYAAPARFYQGSSLKVEGEKAMTKIEFACNNGSYATQLQNSITSGTVTVEGSIVTVTLPSAATSYSVASLAKQVRMNSLTVYYE